MTDETAPVMDQEARVEACCAEIAATLRKFKCRLVAKMLQAEAVGEGSRLLLSAECRVIPVE